MYASTVWCRQPQLSSHQMELMRILERGILRQTANIRRNRGSFKHVCAADVYKNANCIRLDRFAIQNNINFFNNLIAFRNDKFKNICNSYPDKPYQCMPQLFLRNRMGRLFHNDKLLISNRSYSNCQRLVYNVRP